MQYCKGYKGHDCPEERNTWEEGTGYQCDSCWAHDNGTFKGYRVLSPDNIDIAPETYDTYQKACEALAAWVQNYSAQGYYSQTCYNGYVRQISLAALPDYCDIVAID